MEVYVSCDVESDGPIPGVYSMIQLGAAAFDEGGELIDTFSVNLEELEGAGRHPETMKWWAKRQELFDRTRENLEPPQAAMERFSRWLEGLPAPPVMVGYPVCFDFTFIHWYLMRFVGHSPFSHFGLDIKTLAMVALDSEFRGVSKRTMPRHWFDDSPHTHVAVEDAIEQGHLFFAILEELRQSRGTARGQEN